MMRRIAAGVLCFGLFSGTAAGTSIVPAKPELPEYLVQFGPGIVELGSHAEAVLGQALADYRTYQPPTIYVDGYYDRHGTDEHALQMSKRIAETVRDYLVARGVPVGSIETAWHGVANPMIPPGDDAERFSRSVDIRFSAKPNPYRQ
jgi:outer membrane protein OmpA-like peptidoglycan-associated protein